MLFSSQDLSLCAKQRPPALLPWRDRGEAPPAPFCPSSTRCHQPLAWGAAAVNAWQSRDTGARRAAPAPRTSRQHPKLLQCHSCGRSPRSDRLRARDTFPGIRGNVTSCVTEASLVWWDLEPSLLPGGAPSPAQSLSRGRVPSDEFLTPVTTCF